MKIMTLIIIGIIVVSGLIYANSAHAIPFISPEFSYENAKYVIVGKVLSVEILSEPYVQKNDNIYSERFGFALYEIQIEDYLKNPINNSTMKLLGTYTNQRQTMSYETYPYEINQRVLLYIQEINSIPGYDLIIRATNSRVIDDGLCDSGSYFKKGLCVIIDDSTNAPDPPCKSGHSPGANFVFFDCNWVEVPYGWIFENGRWQEDPSIQRIGPQPLPSCPRIDICTCSGEYSYYNSTDQQCHSSPYIPTEYKKSCKQYEQLEFDGWQFNAKYCDWISLSDPYENEESMRLASEKVGVGGLGIDPVFDESIIIIGILIGIGSGISLMYYWRK